MGEREKRERLSSKDVLEARFGREEDLGMEERELRIYQPLGGAWDGFAAPVGELVVRAR
jgi:hypothetical protein